MQSFDAWKIGKKDVEHSQEDNPTDIAEQEIGRKKTRNEIQCLATVGLANEHQHGRIKRRAELHEAVGVG